MQMWNGLLIPDKVHIGGDVSILLCEMKKPPGNYSREALLSLSLL